jgi:hypothetical protein
MMAGCVELPEAGRFRRAVEGRTIARFLQYGDPDHAFPRIYCDCLQERLPAPLLL